MRRRNEPIYIRKNPEYIDRNYNLKALGYNSYPEYCKSEGWQNIRRVIMTLHNGECILCHERATEVHHASYSLDVLCGSPLCPMFLYPLCGKCHDLIEYKRDGKKRTFEEANVCLFRMVRNRYGKDTICEDTNAFLYEKVLLKFPTGDSDREQEVNK